MNSYILTRKAFPVVWPESGERVCTWMHACKRTRVRAFVRACMHACVYVCVCVCVKLGATPGVWQRQTDTHTDRDEQREYTLQRHKKKRDRQRDTETQAAGLSRWWMCRPMIYTHNRLTKARVFHTLRSANVNSALFIVKAQVQSHTESSTQLTLLLFACVCSLTDNLDTIACVM